MYKRQLSLLLLLVSSVSAVGHEQTDKQNRAEAEEQVRGVEDRMTQAIVNKDIATLDRIFADGILYINGNGEILDKTKVLSDYRLGANTLVKLKHDNIRVRVYSNMAVLTGRSNSTVDYKGVATIPRRFTNIFLWIDGRWQIVSHQVTNIRNQ